MKNLMFSYSGKISEYYKLNDIIQVHKEDYVNDTIELENGVLLGSHHDGRFYELLDNGKRGDEYQALVLWDDIKDEGVTVGYVRI